MINQMIDDLQATVRLVSARVTDDDDSGHDDARRYTVPYPRDFAGADFMAAPQLETGAYRLIERYREDLWHLADAEIVYLWKRQGGRSKGKVTAGKCVALSGPAAFFAGAAAGGAPQFLIWLAADVFVLSGDRNIEAALFHELLHITTTEDADGESELVIRGHDWEGFGREIELFGLHTSDARDVATSFWRQAPMRLTLDEAPS